jgi:hypothetical protein
MAPDVHFCGGEKRFDQRINVPRGFNGGLNVALRVHYHDLKRGR